MWGQQTLFCLWTLYFNQAGVNSRPSKRPGWHDHVPCQNPSEFTRLSLQRIHCEMGSELPGPWATTSPEIARAARTVAKILTEVPPPLKWQQLAMTPVSSVTSQESICACAYWSQGVMTRWGLFLASRKRISCSCRVYWILRSNTPYVRSTDMPCWATVIFGDMKRRMKRKIQKVWQYQQIVLSVPSL